MAEAPNQMSSPKSIVPPILTFSSMKWGREGVTRGRPASRVYSSQNPVDYPFWAHPNLMAVLLVASPSSQPLENREVILYYANTVLPRFRIPDKPISLDIDNVMQDKPSIKEL